MPPRPRPLFGTVVALALTAGACTGEAGEAGSRADADTASEPGVVRITATDFQFEAPEEIPSGWTTFRFANEGEQEHFAYIYRIPDDVSFVQYRQQVADVFVRVWNRYASGSLDRGEFMQTLAAEVPEWMLSGGVVPAGGPALTEPGETTQTTVRLDPGTHVIECYVKTPQGIWHTERGMLKELVVTSDSTGVAPPDPDVRLTLSNYEIAVSGEPTVGPQTFAVRVEENPEGFNMHDVNLIRLEGDAAPDEVVAWMDWLELGAFRPPAPGYSLGGVDQMVAGRTGYVTVDLTPGRYLWVSEGYGARGMTREFRVE